MQISKRGALELSMNTIVVIVIGIVLLTLGLTWVRNIFGSVTQISDESIAIARGEIGRISHNEEITVSPENMGLEKGSYKVMKVYVANIGDRRSNFKVTVEPTEELDAKFADTKSKESDEYPIEIGEEIEIQVYVLAKSTAPLGPTGLKFEISNELWEEAKIRTAVIDVKKKSGLF
ncbi:hypothetical protein J4471_03310 [Candidatus Woesearchaeota archaeon]|nr:hypothetical protein [Candidatus Woesearchaeota archaeon]